MAHLFSSGSLRWMIASAIVPVGFYVGLSIRDSDDAEAKEQKRINITIESRLKEQLNATQQPNNTANNSTSK
jgi:hypothetical protein